MRKVLTSSLMSLLLLGACAPARLAMPTPLWSAQVSDSVKQKKSHGAGYWVLGIGIAVAAFLVARNVNVK